MNARLFMLQAATMARLAAWQRYVVDRGVPDPTPALHGAAVAFNDALCASTSLAAYAGNNALVASMVTAAVVSASWKRRAALAAARRDRVVP